MREEIDALYAHGTWDLVPLPHAKNLVGCKRVYRIKKNAYGSIARHKARDTTKRLMSSSKCKSVEVINNPTRPESNHRDCINYRQQQQQ